MEDMSTHQKSPTTSSTGPYRNLNESDTVGPQPLYSWSRRTADVGVRQDSSGSSESCILQGTPVDGPDPAAYFPREVAIEPPPPAIFDGSTLRVRQLWEGTVTELRDGEFVALLADKTKSDNPDEEAVFGFSEVAEADRNLIEPGSSFYWTIGYEQTPAGQLKHISVLQFRRFPRWSRNAISNATRRAQDSKSIFRSVLE